MNYNKRLIDAFKDDEYSKLLMNPNLYKDLIVNRLNRSKKDATCHDLSLIDALDNYVIKTINNYPRTMDNNVFSTYRDFLYNAFRSHPQIAFDSVLFKKNIAQNFFTAEQLKNISSYKNSVVQNCKSELQRVLNTPGLTVSDELLRFAEVQIDHDSKVAKNLTENLYSYLLENENTNKGYFAKEFIARYTASMTAKKLNIPPVNVYISNYSLRGEKISPSEHGCSYGNLSVININKDYALDDNYDLFDATSKGLPRTVCLLQTVAHEVKHSSQAYNAYNGTVSLEAFNYIRRQLFNEYLKYDGTNEYNINYLHNEIECDSNYFGWLETERIVKKYAPSLKPHLDRIVSNSIVTAFQPHTATKVVEHNNSRSRKPKDMFNVKNMDKILNEHPEVLNRFPQLRKIYRNDGTRRDFIERLRLEKSVDRHESGELEKIYEEFNKRDFREGVIQKIDVNGLDEDMQFAFFCKIFDMALEECKSFKNGIKIHGHYTDSHDLRSKEFNRISIHRAERIIQYVEYINSNKGIIERLDRINHSKGIGNMHHFMFRLNYFVDELKSVKKYVNEIKVKYSDDKDKEQMLAELSNLEQAEVFVDGTRK